MGRRAVLVSVPLIERRRALDRNINGGRLWRWGCGRNGTVEIIGGLRIIN